MTEEELQQDIIDLASRLGYLHYHTHDSRRSDYGFPDLCLVSPARRRIIWIECKSDNGKVTAAQAEWQDALATCDQEIYVVYPRHMDEITEILMMGEKPGAVLRCRYDCAVVYVGVH